MLNVEGPNRRAGFDLPQFRIPALPSEVGSGGLSQPAVQRVHIC
jgi:hypothetical protein